MKEEQISLLNEKKQELLSKENNISLVVKDNSKSEISNSEQKSENVYNQVSLVEAQRNYRMRMLRKTRVRSRR